MPATTIPTKTTITLRIIRPKLISDNSRMAAISLQRNRTIPTRMHRSSLRNLHSPSTDSRRTDSRRTDSRITHNRRNPLLSAAGAAPIRAALIQSATNLRAADLLSGGPTAARLRLRAEVEDRRRPARPVPRHPRRAQLLSGIHRQGRGSAVADPDRMDHPYRTDHFRNLGSDRIRPHPVLQLRV